MIPKDPAWIEVYVQLAATFLLIAVIVSSTLLTIFTLFRRPDDAEVS